MAGNQIGKSESGSAETAMHLTGLYPEDWKGHRFTKGIRAWASGVTSLTTRDIIQRKLLGSDGQLGTGWIPKECIVKVVPSRGVPGAFDYAIIKHTTGTLSYVFFKSYEQGREKFQGDSIDWLWFDEEPPMEIWVEGIARLTATKGLAILTFTPLKGLSEVVRSFYPHPDSGEKALVRMELIDARYEDGTGHISDDDIDKITNRYPMHQRDARTKGKPFFGEGLIYDIPESQILESFVEPNPYWRYLVGLDLGGAGSPTAFVKVALDPDTDTLHLMHCYSATDPKIAVHAAALRSSCGDTPVAWPHDANTKSRGDGRKYADIYRSHGVRMLREHAQYEDGSNSVEAGITDLNSRMMEGRFKAAYMFTPFWDEIRLYHRKNGVPVKGWDHVMDALRYAVMSLRYARPLRQRRHATHARGDWDPFDNNRRRRHMPDFEGRRFH